VKSVFRNYGVPGEIRRFTSSWKKRPRALTGWSIQKLSAGKVNRGAHDVRTCSRWTISSGSIARCRSELSRD